MCIPGFSLKHQTIHNGSMSKQSENVDIPDDSPPPYSLASPSSQPVQSLESVSSLLSSHLRNLPGRISSARAARTSEREEQDGEILSLLIPHVEDLIHTVAVMEPPPSRLDMTIVPEDAVGDSWVFSDEDRNHKLVKIRQPKKEHVKEKSAPSREKLFDEWGRWEDGKPSTKEALWWHDDEMASRLAKYLQPDRPRPKPQPLPVEPQQQARKSSWSLFKKNEPPPVYPPPPAPRVKEEPVSLSVKAEEVTFRRENEMGIWESKRGWGLVVRIRVRQ